jgi:hypothetical protein
MRQGSSRDADWAKAMTVLVGSSQQHPVFIRAFSSLWLPSGTPEQVQWFEDLAQVSHSSDSQAKFVAAAGNIDVPCAESGYPGHRPDPDLRRREWGDAIRGRRAAPCS